MNAARYPFSNSAGGSVPSNFAKLRLVIEQLQMARRTGHEQEDDVLRPRPNRRPLDCQRIGRCSLPPVAPAN